MSLMNIFDTKLGCQYHLTFFCKMQTKELINALLPLGFKLNKDNSITWISSYKTIFTIMPFKNQSPDLAGYILHFEGDSKSLVQLINHTLLQLSPSFVNIEMSIKEGFSQKENIEIARQQDYKAESVYGIYTSDKFGIILLPDGTTVIQIRTKNLKVNHLSGIISSINNIAAHFKKEEVIDLFSCSSTGEAFV
ncbi:hypothetical protein M3603_15300 [Rummeliibacillus stabekisii]|uniref:hypothetical protein n=1 Tax=Rummeliibacillus stabekisii TaxID=241244 RepID=UPI00204201C1|nr:hypothetical protein [Rummeliibacillus stabekisii]MCM3317984.1 hypothetical protein [Rummeliibacillus stabekisii]